MAWATEARAPKIIRYASKAKTKFVCMTCFQEVEGWEYQVGYDPLHKISECGPCWAAPRVPPMKPVGSLVVYG